MHTKRSFLPFPNHNLPSWQNQGLQGQKVAFGLHENAEKKVVLWCRRNAHFRPPRTPHLDRAGSSGAAGGGGAANWGYLSPLPPLALFTSSWPNEGARTRIKPTTDARRAPGGGGLPLPAAAAAAPGKYMKTKGSKTKRRKYEREERARKTKREQRGEREREKGETSTFPMKEKQRPSREGTKGIIFLPILEREGKSRKNPRFSSPRHRRARAAHLQERIPFNGF